MEKDDFKQPVEIEDDTTNESLEFRYTITSYGADYPVDSIIKRLNQETIYIPHFQREYVWSIRQASRFIESLLLGLPIPGIFLAMETDSPRLLVIDGQQRLKTLKLFYEGSFSNGKEFRLKGVQERLEGRNYNDLTPDDRITLDDSLIHSTIIKQDYPSEDQSSVYQIFERLNTGGTPLQPQEIRACIYYGDFNELLAELNEVESFREIYGPQSPRMKDQELILRFFSLYYRFMDYKKPLKGFLNQFMSDNRKLDKKSANEFKEIFNNTIDLVHKAIGEKKAFRIGRVINAAIFDSVMVGIAKRLEQGEVKDYNDVYNKYSQLLEDEEFLGLIQGKGSTSDESNVKRRIELSEQYFSEIK